MKFNVFGKRVIVFIITLFSFALILTGMTDYYDFNGISEHDHTFLNMLYFTSTTSSTVGYGDISPKTTKAKIIIILLQVVMTSELLALMVASE